MDKRKIANQQVRDKICQATFQLMKLKPFSDITVTDIIRQAGVARMSYYRNFKTKEEVIRTHMSDVLQNILQSTKMANPLNTFDGILQCWEYFAQQKDVFCSFCTTELSQFLMDFLSKVQTYLPHAPHEDEYYRTAYIGALFNLMRRWIEDGCKEPPEKMARIFCSLWNFPAPAMN